MAESRSTPALRFDSETTLARACTLSLGELKGDEADGMVSPRPSGRSSRSTGTHIEGRQCPSIPSE